MIANTLDPEPPHFFNAREYLRRWLRSRHLRTV